MKKEFSIFIITIIITVLAYSLLGFAYMNDNFVQKDIFELVVKKLDCIETKLDRIIERNQR